MENRTRSAKLMNITAMAAFGTIGYFVAKIPLASEEIAFFRAVIAAVVILAWQLVRGRKFRLPASRKSLILLMASGAMIGFNWIDRTLLQFLVGLIVMFPYVLFKSGFHVMEAGTVGIMNLLVLGVVHTGIGYCLYFSSLGDLKGQEAAILSYIDPMVACAMSVFVMGEAMGLMQAAGGVMILGFTLYNELGGKTPSHPRQKTGCE